MILTCTLIATTSLVIGYLLGVAISKKENVKLQSELILKNQELIKNQTKLENYAELGEIFQNIANNTINQTQESLIKKNQTVLEPFKKELYEFKEKVEQLKNKGIENTTALKEKIDTLTKNSDMLQFKAEELTNSLKANAKERGLFGEMVLEQVLASSGLINKKDNPEKGSYITQKGFKDLNNPTANSLTPDAIVYFPENSRHLVIDAKCPLNYFQNYINTEDVEQKEQYLKEFFNALSRMLEDLSSKYNNLEGLNTPEFKFMFIPIEACLTYIYDRVDIITKATQCNIVIVGPSTLLATLKVIRQAWDDKNISENIKEIQKGAISLYDKFCIFISKLENVGKSFTNVQKDFENLFTTIQGKDGLISRFEKFKQLGINPKKQIDSKYLNNETTELVVAEIE